MITAADFAQIFCAEANVGIEYSYDSAGMRHGVMISGTASILDRVDRFASRLAYAGDWAWAVRRFNASVQPDAFLLRIDCAGENVSGITLYCRFREEPADELCGAALATADPFRWTGPPPSAVAAALGTAGPRGVAFRVDETGEPKAALYFKVAGDIRNMPSETLPKLAALCGLPPAVEECIQEDIRNLYAPGPVGVVGFDSSKAGTSTTIKFDPANVPLRQAFDFLRTKGTTERQISELTGTADSLRALWASYLGVKYNAEGFAGWRLYFSVRPSRIGGPGMTKLAAARGETPTFRLPHY